MTQLRIKLILAVILILNCFVNSTSLSAPAFRFCCPEGMIFDDTFEVQECHSHKGLPLQMTMNITQGSGNVISVDLVELSPPKYNFMPDCSEGIFVLYPFENENDTFEIFQNGTLRMLVYNTFYSQDDYCLSHLTYEDNTTIISPTVCGLGKDLRTQISGCAMAISAVFMLLTVIVYLVVPVLRTLHGKSLCCYLTGLSVGYLIIGIINIAPTRYICERCCSILGYVAYFSLMASFFWVSVISFEVFYKIRIVPGGGYNPKKRFIIYSIYAWGLALIALIITYLVEEYSFVPENWKPQMKQHCWLDVTTNWSAMLYFFGPLFIIISFNITMFVLTARKINSVQREMNRMLERKDSQITIRSDKERFVIFLRLFIVMGVTWSLEVLSYAVGDNSKLKIFFYISDFANGAQGVIIFALFVLRKRVGQIFVRRFNLRWKRLDKNVNKAIPCLGTNINLTVNDDNVTNTIENEEETKF